MLGSLVIIYPTAHEGGELVLRHKDREWKFDSKSLMASRASPSLAYVAFYSDIDHEVLEVTSGRRVTITYNLYLVNPIPDSGPSTVTPNSACALQTTLRRLLKSAEFLPNGGILGFGLAHLYPVSGETTLDQITCFLKGEDAYVYRACQEVQLQPLLRMIYDDDMSGKGYGILVDRIVTDPKYNYENGSYESVLVEMGGLAVNTTEDASMDFCRRATDHHDDGEDITWVTPFNTRNKLRDIAQRYGNELTVEYMYSSPCMIVYIDPASDRV